MTTQTITAGKTRFTFWFSISLLAGFVSLMATGCSGSAISKERTSQPSGQLVNNQAAINQQSSISQQNATQQTATQQTAISQKRREDSPAITDWSAQQDPSVAIAIDLVNAMEADIDLSDTHIPFENPPSISDTTDSDRPTPNRVKKKAPSTIPARFDVTPEVTPSDVLMRAEGRDITYAQQPFERAIFNQLREAGFCAGVGYCSNASYLFSDVILSAQAFEQVSADITVIPHQPVSKEVALAYARILDIGASIDFVTAQVDQDISTETYFERGLPSSESAMALGSTKMAQLRMTPSGTVSEISFSYIVF